jgi:hypothetical protein
MWCHLIDGRAGHVIIERVARRATTKTDSRLAARLAAIASLGAAVIHFAVLPTHWQEWTPSGLFFASIALFQLIWARLVRVRPASVVLAAGIVANVGAAALWTLSRTAGAPFGPHAAEPELVQAAGICALLLECYVVMGAGWVWYRGQQPAPIPAFGNAIVLLGASAVMAAAATVGAASGLQHGHHAPAGTVHSHHEPSTRHEDGHHDHQVPPAPPDHEAGRPSTAPAPVEPPPRATDPAHETDGDHHHDG